MQTSKNSRFYTLVPGVYKIDFMESHSFHYATLKNDSTFTMADSGHHGRMFVKGNWFLSDSLIFFKITWAEMHDCLSSEVTVSDDSTKIKLISWKIVKMDSTGFSCIDTRKRWRKKVTMKAVRTDLE